ncbi:family 16 glycosylhydrolase [Kineosporia sp. A_224]|uniref:glycoside hydrolase family 16 protein n=1 Tax=Kineosporia sp. A_224 TaxID=1962180 RepID=UPI000B4BF34A|nr:glycoside hydrolase family 16 protein [Kineosporia sp. A_224]
MRTTAGRRGAGAAGAALAVVAVLACLALLAACGSPATDPTAFAPEPGRTPSGPTPSATGPTGPTGVDGTWRLVWSDEFDGPAGAGPDRSRWGFDTGAGGWGNDELETYTDSTRNARITDEGTLEIVARREGAGFTSARLSTESTFRHRYGAYEARLRLPAGRGLWPAFWLNGICAQGWPDCGEIDVMESVDAVPRTVRGRVHLPGPDARPGLGRDWPVASALDQGFHVYGVVWDPQFVAFSFDGHEYARVRKDRLPDGDRWELDHEAYLLLNVAVGGRWPGSPDATTPFPSRLTVDWVRAWDRVGS